ncbi:MAG: pyridoxamine 5'-phosphate oxidase family protein [Coprobacillaceae bacterium]
MRDPNKTIRNMIDKQKTAYISSVDNDGFPNTKAMLAPRLIEGIKVFYFTTNTSSKRVQQYKENNKACIYFSDQRFFRGVMLQGVMEVLEDQESKQKIWQEGDTMYYSKGVSDPDYCVLRFTATKGRYYSNFSSEDFDIK